jgi:hypothetical protein
MELQWKRGKENGRGEKKMEILDDEERNRRSRKLVVRKETKCVLLPCSCHTQATPSRKLVSELLHNLDLGLNRKLINLWPKSS